MEYKVNEIFLSIKGEGHWMGYPMWFVRLATCNLACKHCDTRFNEPIIKMTDREIFKQISDHGPKYVVITGGEPTVQNLDDLLGLLHTYKYSTHLESNGTKPLGATRPSWICISPKLDDAEPLVGNIVLADEIKMPIRNLADLDRAEAFRSRFENVRAEWLLHPWNDQFEFEIAGSRFDEEGARTLKGYSVSANELCIEHAKKAKRLWRVSPQLHKIWAIR